MKKAFIAIAAMLCSLALGARDIYPKPYKTQALYPEGQASGRGIIENGREITLGAGESNGYSTHSMKDPERMQEIGDDAFMEIYLPKKGNGQMILCCPGGGYAYVSFANEGKQVADWALKKGIAVCVLYYRLPNGHCTVPLTDAQNAMRYCRAHAGEWGINQIGVMGFSAGGHLAGSASVLYTDNVTRPDFSVLVYPVIDLTPALRHSGTSIRLTAEDPELMEYYSLENHVNAMTPPTLLLLCADDRAVPPMNSVIYYEKMLEHKVPGELHIFPKGGHGFGFTTEKFGTDRIAPYRAEFFAALERFLKERRDERGI